MELASRFLDGAATDQELERLDAIVRENPRALEALAELLHQHGTLAWTQRGQASFRKNEDAGPDLRGEVPTKGEPRRRWWIAVPLAACLLITFAVIRLAPSGI